MRSHWHSACISYTSSSLYHIGHLKDFDFQFGALALKVSIELSTGNETKARLL